MRNQTLKYQPGEIAAIAEPFPGTDPFVAVLFKGQATDSYVVQGRENDDVPFTLHADRLRKTCYYEIFEYDKKFKGGRNV